MSVERTFVAVKPDGVERGLVGEIIGRFERRGLKLVGMKLMVVPVVLAENHYGEHKGKPFFEGLVKFITGGPIVAMVWEGKNAITLARNVIGATNPTAAAQGTIRGDLATELGVAEERFERLARAVVGVESRCNRRGVERAVAEEDEDFVFLGIEMLLVADGDRVRQPHAAVAQAEMSAAGVAGLRLR